MNTDHQTISNLIYLAGIGTASSIGYKDETEKNGTFSSASFESLGKWLSTFSRRLNNGKA